MYKVTVKFGLSLASTPCLFVHVDDGTEHGQLTEVGLEEILEVRRLKEELLKDSAEGEHSNQKP